MASEEPAGPSLCTQLCSATVAAENPGKALGMVRVFHLQPALEERGITGSFPPPFPTSASGGTITTKCEMDASLMAILHHALVPPTSSQRGQLGHFLGKNAENAAVKSRWEEESEAQRPSQHHAGPALLCLRQRAVPTGESNPK